MDADAVSPFLILLGQFELRNCFFAYEFIGQVSWIRNLAYHWLYQMISTHR
jgi:hypothetical protein